MPARKDISTNYNPILTLIFLPRSLQSRRKSVFVESPEQVNIESRAGPSTLSAYGSICINSRDILQLHSKSILFSGLKATGQATSTSKASLQVSSLSLVFHSSLQFQFSPATRRRLFAVKESSNRPVTL